jgi:hypothetical protein
MIPTTRTKEEVEMEKERTKNLILISKYQNIEHQGWIIQIK